MTKISSKIFWIMAESVIFNTPEIFESNLEDGFFIAIQGMIIFNSREEAEKYIEEAHKLILEKGGKLY